MKFLFFISLKFIENFLKLKKELENETLEQRKFREAKLVQDADFQNTLDLFGGKYTFLYN